MANLYLFRHGEAEMYSGSQKDADRALTRKGQEDVRVQARRLFGEQGVIDTVFHSPYRRARETAQLINETTGAPLRVMEGLTPMGVAETAADTLLGNEGNLLWVTHLPLVAELAYLLTGQDVNFYQGSCAKIIRKDIYAISGALAWLRHPD